MSLIPRKVRPKSRKVRERSAAILERMERESIARSVAEARRPADTGDAASAGRRFAPWWLRKRVLERDGYRCRYCRRPVHDGNANMDHIIPWPEGLTVYANLATACRPCNQAKGRRRWHT